MNKQIMNSEIFKKGFAYIETLDKKDQTDPLLESPLASIGHPDGWKTVVTLLILEKGYTFADAAKKLKDVWPDVLSAVKAKAGKNAKMEICTEPALRRRVLQVSTQRYKQAKAKLKGKLTPEKKAEQTRILEEVKNLYEFLELKLPVSDEKEGKSDVEAATEAGNADNATVPADMTPAAAHGEPPTAVGEASQVSADAVPEAATAVKKDPADRTPPTEPLVDTGAQQKPENQVGSAGNNGNDGNGLQCPECYGQMVIKTARQGKNKGHIFYGCAAWRDTKCKGTRDPKGQDTTRRD